MLLEKNAEYAALLQAALDKSTKISEERALELAAKSQQADKLDADLNAATSKTQRLESDLRVATSKEQKLDADLKAANSKVLYATARLIMGGSGEEIRTTSSTTCLYPQPVNIRQTVDNWPPHQLHAPRNVISLRIQVNDDGARGVWWWLKLACRVVCQGLRAVYIKNLIRCRTHARYKSWRETSGLPIARR